MLDTGRIGALVKGANLLQHGAVRAGDALVVAQMFDPGGLEPGLNKAGGVFRVLHQRSAIGAAAAARGGERRHQPRNWPWSACAIS